MIITYYEYDGERYDTYEEVEEDMRKAFDQYLFDDYFTILVHEGDILSFDILNALSKGDTEFYYEVYEKCFDRYKDDYLSEWTEDEED